MMERKRDELGHKDVCTRMTLDFTQFHWIANSEHLYSLQKNTGGGGRLERGFSSQEYCLLFQGTQV